ncbi:hypothetical protein PsorP6_004108 [Peronosclerospora sorghi]|uniref:Uncharacterized protein n=1 Tax=Peronosclerospora sorghi TaxID=230839 RepID=A0ACC0VNE2_9STRA|nr:hypothetical protein PsorP6_004108 [Peronosclerospora sorghi]
MGQSPTRRGVLVFLAIVVYHVETGISTNLLLRCVNERKEVNDSVVKRCLMPIRDGSTSTRTDNDESRDCDDEKSNMNAVVVGASVGVAFLLVTVCLTWKACLECCTKSNQRSGHRAFIERTDTGWKCKICYHHNDFSQKSCVLCGTMAEGLRQSSKPKHIGQESTFSSQGKSNDESVGPENSTLSADNYVLMATPRSAWRAGHNTLSNNLNDRQLVALERFQWKRCVGKKHVKIPLEALSKHGTLRGTMIRERDFLEWKKHNAPQSATAVEKLASVNFSGRSRRQLAWMTPETAFVCDDARSGGQVVLAGELLMPSLFRYIYVIDLLLIVGLLSAGIHRDKVLKQSMALFLSAPSATLHRRLRVDFMNENGIDGGGILREWLHLVCNQLFVETQGLFALTSSAAHQGYWIKRTAAKKTTDQLNMYVFFGRLIGKAMLEGLLLNVRLSIPLLKHLLGVPLKVSDLYLLDETVYSSVTWILSHESTSTLGLNFVVENTELIPSGADVSLHDGNKQLYVAKVAQYYLFDSIQAEIASIMDGLQSILSDNVLHVFDFKELDLVLSGLPHIDVNDWKEHTEIRFYEQSNHELDLIRWFWEIVESFSQCQRGRLLQYVTGSSGVPVEGFKGLTGMDGQIQLFTIHLGKEYSTVYTVLPHASTCLNRLDLPLYSSKAELEQILSMVIDMDVTGFSGR